MSEKPIVPPEIHEVIVEELASAVLADVRARSARKLGPPPPWVEGGISSEDADFLRELVRAVEPHLVLEIGVGAGTSSAALLFALDMISGPSETRYLFSADIRPTCYFDENRRTGSAVEEMYPRPRRAAWRLMANGFDARRSAEALKPESVDLAWIDADHRHPFPLLDVLYLAPVLRPRAWIALHDIDLPRLYPAFPHHGPMWLFENWPGEKFRQVAPGDSNIGAVRLPAELGALVPMAVELLGRPLEAEARAEGLAPVFEAVTFHMEHLRRQARPAGRQ